MHTRIALVTLLPLLYLGCAVVTVADAAVTVVATTVKVNATVVETAVDVTAAGVKAVVGSDQTRTIVRRWRRAAENPTGPYQSVR